MLRLDDIADNIAAAATVSPEDRSPLAQAASDADPLPSVEQTGGRLNYRPSYVYELVRSGQLTAVKVAKCVRVRASAWTTVQQAVGDGRHPGVYRAKAPSCPLPTTVKVRSKVPNSPYCIWLFWRAADLKSDAPAGRRPDRTGVA